MHKYTTLSIEDCVIGLLALGRLLSEIVGSVPTGIEMRGAKFDRFFADLAAGNVLVPGHGAIVSELCEAVLTYFERECPGHIETMFRGTLQDFPLLNPEWATARAFWDTLLQFRVERQHLEDQVRAIKLAAELRRRPHL